MKTRRTVSLVSLGCPKNLVDSEGLVSTLLSNDFRVVTDPKESEVVIVNTCGFLDASRTESVSTIREMCDLKKGGVRGVLVAGCMVGNYREQLMREVPGVDGLVNFGDYGRIDRIVDGLFPREEVPQFTVERRRIDASLTPRHTAYLKISEGCNRPCAFCVIPQIRGKMRSTPMEELVTRARGLAARGVRELNLIAQDSTVWGADLYGEIRLAELLRRLDEVDGLAWIRLMYAFPTEVTAPVIEAIAAGTNTLKYLDVPIQHAADAVLQRMRRGYGRRLLEEMVSALRTRMPEVGLRTTVIVGFPGETEADFQQLLDYLTAARFERLGAFRYSREATSEAADLPDQVPEAVKEERWHRLMALQQTIAFENAARTVGTTQQVLFDAPAQSGRPARGRTRHDAPEVDASVLVDDATIRGGDLVAIRITATAGYDLIGQRG